MKPMQEGPHYKIILRELGLGPRDSRQLRDLLECHETTIMRQMRVALVLEDAHIKAWTRNLDGGPTPTYALGPGKNARRPRPYTQQQRNRLRRAKAENRGAKYEGAVCGRCYGTVRYVKNNHCISCKGANRDGTAREFSNHSRDLRHRKELAKRLGESW